MKKLEINKMIIAGNLLSDAKRHSIRVGAWVGRWVGKGKSAIKSQGACKVQNLKMPFWLTGSFVIARQT